MKSNNVHLCVKKPQVISSLSTFLHTKSRRTHCFRAAGFLWNDVPTSFPLRYFCQLEFDRFYLGKREIHGVHLSIPTCAQRLKITQKSLIFSKTTFNVTITHYNMNINCSENWVLKSFDSNATFRAIFTHCELCTSSMNFKAQLELWV